MGPLVYNRPLGGSGRSAPPPSIEELQQQQVEIGQQVQDIRERNAETRRLWADLPVWARITLATVLSLIAGILILALA